jgi:hypothetical protein
LTLIVTGCAAWAASEAATSSAKAAIAAEKSACDLPPKKWTGLSCF